MTTSTMKFNTVPIQVFNSARITAPPVTVAQSSADVCPLYLFGFKDPQTCLPLASD